MGAGTYKLKNQKPLWTCPKCNRHFANTNQSHSCAAMRLKIFCAAKTQNPSSEHPRFVKIEELTTTCFVNHFKIKDESELDDDVRGWMKEAYRVGRQENLKSA